MKYANITLYFLGETQPKVGSPYCSRRCPAVFNTDEATNDGLLSRIVWSYSIVSDLLLCCMYRSCEQEVTHTEKVLSLVAGNGVTSSETKHRIISIQAQLRTAVSLVLA